MKKLSFNSLIVGYLIAGGVESLGALIYLLSIPTDSKNALLCGYSLSRLGTAFGFLIITIVLVLLAIKSKQDKGWRDRLENISNQERLTQVVVLSSAFVSLLGWVSLVTPTYWFWTLRDYFAYFERLRPAIIWLTLMSAQAVIVVLLGTYGSQWARLKEMLNTQKNPIQVSVTILGFFLFGWAIIYLSKLGFQPDVLWGIPGSPILNWQVLLALGACAFVVILSKWLTIHRKGREKAGFLDWMSGKLDLLICILIWLGAATLWIKEPMPPTYSAPGLFEPNYEPYPYGDASTYDTNAHLVLLGQGLGNTVYMDKPFYVFFLTALNFIAGSNFNLVISLQVAIMAIFPVALYLIGKSLGGRIAGVVVAGLAICKGVNAIAMRDPNASHSKVMLSEYLTMIMVVLFTYWIIHWLQDPKRNYRSAMAAGGILGIATLTRHNVWLLLPAGLLIAMAALGRCWKKWLRFGLLFGGTLLIGIAPWMCYYNSVRDTPFYFMAALKGTVWKNRYLTVISRAPVEPAPQSTPIQNAGSSNLQATQTITQPETGEQNIYTGNEEIREMSEKEFTVPEFIGNHFLHNLVSTAVTLPTIITFDDIQHAINQPPPYAIWGGWDGSLSLEGKILLVLNLSLIAVGVGFSWYRWKYAGLAPMFVFLAYNLSAAIARTSGGRYLVPMDWAAFLYFGIGLIQVATWGAILFRLVSEDRQDKKTHEDLPAHNIYPTRDLSWGTVAIALTFFGLGLAVPTIKNMFPRKYPDQTEQEVLTAIHQNGSLEQLSFNRQEIETYLYANDAVAFTGRALYPQFYYIGQGGPGETEYLKQFSHLTFRLIGPNGITEVTMLLETLERGFPHAADVAVLGCRSNGKLDAVAVVNLQPEGFVYERSPSSPLACPLE